MEVYPSTCHVTGSRCVIFNFFTIRTFDVTGRIFWTTENNRCTIITFGVRHANTLFVIQRDHEVTMGNRLFGHTTTAATTNEILPTQRNCFRSKVRVITCIQYCFENQTTVIQIQYNFFMGVFSTWLIYTITDFENDIAIVLLFEHDLGRIFTARHWLFS